MISKDKQGEEVVIRKILSCLSVQRTLFHIVLLALILVVSDHIKHFDTTGTKAKWHIHYTENYIRPSK